MDVVRRHSLGGIARGVGDQRQLREPLPTPVRCRRTDMEIRIGASAGFAVNQGAIVVVSAGNNRIDIGDSRRFPCTVNNTICVGAVDRKFANLGNFGAKVDIWNRRRHSDDT